jgi:hypothetical protein
MSYKKDPDATLDYYFTWKPLTHGETGAKRDWLATDETIIHYTLTASEGIVIDSHSQEDGKVTFWLSGGTATTWYTVACKIVTNAGRTDERTMNILVLDR